MSKILRRHPLALAIAAALAVSPLTASAQDTSNLSADAQTANQPTINATGLPLGSFLLYPEVALTGIYNDNIYFTRTDRKADTITVLSPSIYARSNWKKNRLDIGAGLDAARFTDNPTENYTNGWVNLQGRLDLTQSTNLFGGAGIDYQHESRSSQDAFVGQYPTRYRDNHANLGFSQSLGPWTLRVAGTASQLDYFNVENSIGWTNDLRDRTVSAGGARLTYRMTPQYGVFLQGARDVRSYESKVDNYGYNRDSSGYRAVAGLKFAPTRQVKGEVFVGHLRQDYTDSRFDPISAPDFGANVQWQPSPLTMVTGYVSRSLEETTLTGTPGYLYSSVGGKVTHWLNGKTRLNGHLSYGRANYKQIDRKDNVVDAGLGVDYRLTRGLFLETSYRVLSRNSNVSNTQQQYYADYIDNQVSVGLRQVFYPVPQVFVPSGTPLGSASPNGLGGFYGGLQYGYALIGTQSTGGRGSHGSDNGNMGTFGGIGGGFLGYGFVNNRWYLGLELHGNEGDTTWYHNKTKTGGREFSSAQKNDYGASLRLGYVLANGTLPYVNVGAVNTHFNTLYAVDGATPVEVDKHLTGTELGVGVEVPTSAHSFVRLAYNYITYPKYDVTYSDGSTLQTDTLQNTQSQVMLGVGLRFREQPRPHFRAKVDGFYAGAQFGDNSLHSNFDADQTDSGGGGTPTTSHLQADFAKAGFSSGLFAGYGKTFKQHYYLGLEGEVDNAHTGWQHTRTPTGRSFSVEQNASYGASVRLGYVMNSGTLIYGKLGAVRTRFNTQYKKGNNSSAWVNRDDIKTGEQYGLGVQLPITRNVFTRVEYSYRQYQKYTFTTANANADTVQIENSSALFQVGLGVVF